MERPPATRVGHKRLPSIDNTDWEEEDAEEERTRRKKKKGSRRRQQQQQRDESSSSDLSDDEAEKNNEFSGPEQNEHTKLLPPSGISSNEYYDAAGRRYHKSSSGPSTSGASAQFYQQPYDGDPSDLVQTMRMGNTTSAASSLTTDSRDRRKQRKKKKKDRSRSRRSSHRHGESSEESSSQSQNSTSDKDYKRWLKKRARLLEKERGKLIKQWRMEAKADEKAAQQEAEDNQWYNRLYRYGMEVWKDQSKRMYKKLTWVEAFIANLPLTIGGVALAFANLGVDWFKFAEETMDSCMPVHFHSAQCTFPEVRKSLS
jgi:hypothetical protein